VRTGCSVDRNISILSPNCVDRDWIRNRLISPSLSTDWNPIHNLDADGKFNRELGLVADRCHRNRGLNVMTDADIRVIRVIESIIVKEAWIDFFIRTDRKNVKLFFFSSEKMYWLWRYAVIKNIRTYLLNYLLKIYYLLTFFEDMENFLVPKSFFLLKITSFSQRLIPFDNSYIVCGKCDYIICRFFIKIFIIRARKQIKM